MDKTDKVDVSKNNPGAGLIPFGAFSVVLGIAMIAVCIIFIIDEGISALQQLLGTVESPYAQDFTMPYIILAGGVVSIVCGGVAIIGGVLKNRIIGVVAIILAFAAAGTMIGPAVYLNSVLTDTFNRLQVNSFDADPQFTPKEQSLLDVVSALYNECCFKVYDARCGSEYNTGSACSPPLYDQGTGINLGSDIRDNQLPVLLCESEATSCNAATQYPPIIATIQGVVPNLVDLLCICYSDNATITRMTQAITELDSCSSLRKIVIENAQGIVIPTSPLTYGELPTYVGVTRDELKTQVLDRFAVIGKMYPPKALFPGDKAEEIGWSCGLGYAKGLAFAIYLGLDNASKVATTAAYVIGGFQAFVAVCLSLYWLLGGGNNDDEWDLAHYDPPTEKNGF